MMHASYKLLYDVAKYLNVILYGGTACGSQSSYIAVSHFMVPVSGHSPLLLFIPSRLPLTRFSAKSGIFEFITAVIRPLSILLPSLLAFLMLSIVGPIPYFPPLQTVLLCLFVLSSVTLPLCVIRSLATTSCLVAHISRLMIPNT